MAGRDGYLVFIDTANGVPAIPVSKIMGKDEVLPFIPYLWQEGMLRPEIATDKKDLKEF